MSCNNALDSHISDTLRSRSSSLLARLSCRTISPVASDTLSPARLDGAPVRFLFHAAAPDARCHYCGFPFARMSGTAPAFAYQSLEWQGGDDFAPVAEPYFLCLLCHNHVRRPE